MVDGKKSMFESDVIVVGGGPSGLMVASELALAGASVTVLERRTTAVESRAGTILPRTLEILQSRGLAEEFIARSHRVVENPLYTTHIWGGMRPIDLKSLNIRYGFRLIVPQNVTEDILREHALSLGVSIIPGAEVVGLTPRDSHVNVTAAGEEYAARYVIGADGGRSFVRTALGIGFEGHSGTFTGIVADIVIPPLSPEGRYMTENERGWLTSFPFGVDDEVVTRVNMVHVDQRTKNRSIEVTADDVQTSISEILGRPFEFSELRWASRFTDAHRRASTLRSGNVFLVGESARIHYPASGVGMNFCLQDALDLGWKMGAVLRGDADEALLDTYENERGPVMDELLRSVKAQCAVQFNFTPEGIALRSFFRERLLPLPEVNEVLARDGNGMNLRYPTRNNTHPIEGRPVIDLNIGTVDGTTTIGEALRTGQFVLVNATGGGEYDDLASMDALNVLTGVFQLAPEEYRGVVSLLIRPDGYVAWASDEPASVDEAVARYRQAAFAVTGA